MRAFLVILALVAAAPAPADACAVGSPCTKYKRRDMTPKVMQIKPVQYTRRAGSTFRSFTRSKVVAFLAGAQWDPGPIKAAPAPNVKIIPPLPLRFVEASRASRAQQSSTTRIVLVRRIEYRDGVTMIEVDNDIYALEKCDGKKRMCLTLRTDLSFDPPPEEQRPE